jgi:hypothetical protein
MALRSVGCRPIPSAGIHVHIDGTAMTAEQVASVGRAFAKFEDCIYRVASSGWNEVRSGANHYAKPLTNEQVKAIAKAKTDRALAEAYYPAGGRTSDPLARGTYHGDVARYFGLNLHSWFYRKTIEYRVFNSSLNPERIQGYVAMCMALTEIGRANRKSSINKRYALGDMATGAAKEEAARHRFLQVLRYEGGNLDVVDMKRLTKIWKDSKPQRRETLGVT